MAEKCADITEGIPGGITEGVFGGISQDFFLKNARSNSWKNHRRPNSEEIPKLILESFPKGISGLNAEAI